MNRGMHFTQPPTISCGRRNYRSLLVFDDPLLAQFLPPAPTICRKGTSASTYAMLRDDHTADKKTRMATAGQTGIDGMLRLTKNVAQTP